MAKFVVLGGGGCFGENLARYLTDKHEVITVGRSPRRPRCFSLGLNCRHYIYHVGRDTEFIVDLLETERPEYIVNFAAQGEGAASFKPKHWKYFYETNMVALVELTERLIGKEWLRKFIQIGTSELYGSCERPMKETDPIVPTSAYANSKAAFDNHLVIAAKAGLLMNIVRPSNCYTPGQQLHRIIPKAILCGLLGQKLPLHGGGRAEKSYLHATDLSKAILLVAEKAPDGEIYNVGPDKPTSIKEVVSKCAAAVGRSLEELAEIADEREGQDSRYWLDSSKVKALGWKQEIGWVEGLFDMYRWLYAYKDELVPTEFSMRA